MSALVADPWPYLAFVALHYVAGQPLAALIYRLRFGGSPLVLHRRERSGATHKQRTRVVGLATIAWVSAFAAAAFSSAFRDSLIGAPLFDLDPRWGWSVGGLGLVVMVSAQISMGASFRVGQDESERPVLVTTGLHGRSRNPVYVGSVLYLAGVSLWAPCLGVGLGLAALAAGIHSLVLAEERWLASCLGDTYSRYRAQVGRYL